MPGSLEDLPKLARPRRAARDRRAPAPGGPPAAPAVPDDADAALLAAYRRGEPGALGALLDRHEAGLFRFLTGVLQDHHQAEDALQETWCRALERLDDVDPRHFRGWLYTVAYHQAMLGKRKQKGTTPSADAGAVVPDPDSCPVAHAESREAAARVRALLERLSPVQREVIRQRIFEGKRFQDIARDMDCPLNTALARMHEGLKRLRRLWGAEYV